jgi:hypothetical protein
MADTRREVHALIDHLRPQELCDPKRKKRSIQPETINAMHEANEGIDLREYSSFRELRESDC